MSEARTLGGELENSGKVQGRIQEVKRLRQAVTTESGSHLPIQ
jgi:hypothetical protein